MIDTRIKSYCSFEKPTMWIFYAKLYLICISLEGGDVFLF